MRNSACCEKNAGLTQRQVADAVGVTYRTYQNYEAGASMPAGDTTSRLAAPPSA